MTYYFIIICYHGILFCSTSPLPLFCQNSLTAWYMASLNEYSIPVATSNWILPICNAFDHLLALHNLHKSNSKSNMTFVEHALFAQYSARLFHQALLIKTIFGNLYFVNSNSLWPSAGTFCLLGLAEEYLINIFIWSSVNSWLSVGYDFIDDTGIDFCIAIQISTDKLNIVLPLV